MSLSCTGAASGEFPFRFLRALVQLYGFRQMHIAIRTSLTLNVHSSPFVQRVWIALELKDMDYQYIEVDPYKKPESLLEVNPLGLVPALRHGNWACHESTVLMEYVRTPPPHPLRPGPPLLPKEEDIPFSVDLADTASSGAGSAGGHQIDNLNDTDCSG
jgi:hypothetical protein